MRILLVVMLALLGAACSGMTAAQRERLAATQTVVDERVRAGKMTEAEGRLATANVKAEIDTENRRTRAMIARPTVYQPVGGGTVIQY